MKILKNLGSIPSRNWRLTLLLGLAAIGFGILSFLTPRFPETWTQPGHIVATWIFGDPHISPLVLVYLFGLYALVQGIVGVSMAVHARNEPAFWSPLLLWGLLGAALGILAFVRPDMTALALRFYIALGAIATGVVEIAAAIRLREVIKHEWLLITAGLFCVAFGVWLIAHPEVDQLAVRPWAWGVMEPPWPSVELIGAYAIVFGVLLLFFALTTRSFVSRITDAVSGRVA